MSERPQVQDDAVPALARGVKLRFDKARDAWVLLAPEKVLMPDQIAVEILKRCDHKASVAEIGDDLAAAFSADRDQVAADVRSFLQDLADKGLLALYGAERRFAKRFDDDLGECDELAPAR
jgi:pyrroloquinoline quinone biosynthesis protein D